jgi:polysaccharide deacetylase 2 family uncharacterized protein YibQ
VARLTTGRSAGGARLPLVLLLVALGSIAGASIWLTLATDHEPGAAAVPRVEVRLTAATSSGAPASAATKPSLPVANQPVPEPSPPMRTAPARAAPEPAAPKPTAPEPPAAAPHPPAKPVTAAKPVTVAEPPPRPKPARPKETTRAPPIRSARGVPRIIVQPLPSGMTLPRVATGPPLSIAPDPALVQRGEFGLLPIIGADDREPWRVYARPFDATDKRPRIAIVVTGLGHSSAETEAAIQGLPGAVTLAFSPYSRRLGESIRLARAAGHEVLLNVPMEPVNYPDYDPGPHTLLTSLDQAANNRRLMWALGRVTGYVGVVDHWGSRFTASRRHMRPVLAALNARGLLFLDSRGSTRSATARIAASIGLPWADNAHFIDQQASREKIDARLRELEAIARRKGRAVGMGSPYPVTLERIAAWTRGADRRGFVLVPISAAVVRDRPK